MFINFYSFIKLQISFTIFMTFLLFQGVFEMINFVFLYIFYYISESMLMNFLLSFIYYFSWLCSSANSKKPVSLSTLNFWRTKLLNTDCAVI